MTDQTTPTEAPAFPERAIREAFPSWDDQKTVQGQWTSWTPQRQAEFATAVQDADPADLTRLVAGFLDERGTDSPTPDPEGVAGGSGPEGTGTGGSSGQTPAEASNDGDPAAKELEDALDTIETAEAYADANPDRIEALLAAEQGREKPRKTLVEALERAQRRRDREAKQGE